MTDNEMTIDIIVEDENWFEECSQDTIDLLVRNALTQSLGHMSLPAGFKNGVLEVNVLLSNNDTVQVLNKTYRDKDKPTNVLSFPQLDMEVPHPEDMPLHLGDIILALQVVKDESAAQNKNFEAHLSHLVTHGFLHLLGYDHETDEEAKIMENVEIKILDKLGYENPYKDENNVA